VVNRRALVGAVGAALAASAIAAYGTGAFAGNSPKPPTRQEVAQRILDSPAGQHADAALLSFLRSSAGGQGRLAPGSEATLGEDHAAAVASGGLAVPAKITPAAAGGTNVRVNDPSTDHFIDQTTQSETTIAVSGQNVVVGYNDSAHTLPFLTAASNLTGYSYSTDGGASFTDAGDLPDQPGQINFGDPWLGADRAGNVYYSTLAEDGTTGNLLVSVGKSTDGGKTFATPVTASPNSGFYSADKDALTVGPDPANPGQDNVYVAWDDLSFDFTTGVETLGLPVARSTDGGQTYQVSYADQITPTGCSFGQYIGAQPLVDPTNGTLYVFAEKFSVDDPDCLGAPETTSEWVFKSTDGGQTFGPGTQIAEIQPASPEGFIDLGPGRAMRTAEFPTAALWGGTLYVAWNEGHNGHSHIHVASSADGGASWSAQWLTRGDGDEVQPAMSLVGSTLDVAFYQRNADNTVDVRLASTTDGNNWKFKRVTTQSFPGDLTAPNFDPIIAPAYMGDYIANVSDGTNAYIAWGDNRDIVTNELWPNGRNDPDVFFAKR
jgi:hypothetical protein